MVLICLSFWSVFVPNPVISGVITWNLFSFCWSNMKNKNWQDNSAFASDDGSWQAEAEIDMELFHQVGAAAPHNTLDNDACLFRFPYSFPLPLPESPGGKGASLSWLDGELTCISWNFCDNKRRKNTWATAFHLYSSARFVKTLTKVIFWNVLQEKEEHWITNVISFS